jgi:dolichol-phosphate mannosyltransferase
VICIWCSIDIMMTSRMKLIKNLLKKYQFLRFFMIWWMAALTDIILLFIFTEFFGIYYILSAVLSFSIVTTIAFYSHKKLTFGCERKDVVRQLFIFFTVNIWWLILYLSILYGWTEILWFYYIFVSIVDKFIVLGWNYGLNKFITFRNVSH